ncbi:MAG: diguanylate cyclase, partial [Actinobacteria bacterium]|nr:diguanylate cyclase [Actinomycetota bacterium]
LSEIPVNTRNILESTANLIGGAVARLADRETLKESERKYRLLFERSLDGIYRTTVKGKYLDVNQALVKMLGYKNKEELLKIDIPTQLYVKKSDRPGPKDRKKIFTTQLRRKDGSIIWAEINSIVIHNIDGIIYYEGIVRDITEKKKTEEKLKYLSFHDKLTCLYNRAYFESELDRLNTKRQLPISMIICDLNSLKLVNDAFGHEEGDKLLKRVANMIKIFFRAEDIIARWGGDEFSIILPKTPRKTAEDIVSRIRKACKKTRSSKIPLSISIGVATKEKPAQNMQSIIREAEDNMYRNKLLEKDSITHSLISSLERSLFEKSHETREHTDRLNKLAIKLGRASNLAESELDKLSLLSVLHDIGKVAIPEEILKKKGKLTRSEWNTIKRHPVIGSNICESSPLLVHIANSILCHHEWWDGNGYPRGIKGDDIPIISRIITIVDAYDVMTHDRAYKKAMTKDKAIEELKRYSRTQFDPRLVEKFIKIVSDKYNN